jgi:ligand-binding sensor domain-containing protein
MPFISPIPVLPPAALDHGWQVWPTNAQPEPAYTAVISGTQLWVGTANGVMYIDLQTGVSHRYEEAGWQMIMSLHDKSAPLFTVDKQGGSWVASRETGELWHYANGKEAALSQQFPPHGLSALHATDQLWAVDRNTLALYVDDTWRHIPTPMLGNISRLAGSPDGRIWLMGDRGIAVYDPAADRRP